MMDENKYKRAAVIQNKVFISNKISISEETNILLIDDELQGVEVKSFWYNLQQTTKKLICQSIPKIWVNLKYQPTWFTIPTQKISRSVL